MTIKRNFLISALISLLVSGFLLPNAIASSAKAPFSGKIIIADEGNNRLVVINAAGQVKWTFPQPGDLAPGQTFKTPDDVFFSADGKQLIVTESEHQMIAIVDIATRKIVYQYGVAGKASAAKGHLRNPDDAMMLSDGRIVIADIANCRVLFVNHKNSMTSQFGLTGSCRHNPPKQFGSPNGAFPNAAGNFIVTEINGDWIDEMTITGKILWSAHAPGVSYPSDANEISANRYLTVDFVHQGQIVEFNRAGKLLWRYRPTGTLSLDHPSLALPLPNKMVIATDDANHRIIIVDPTLNRVVWQYGKKGKAGTAAGLLNNPDGLDFVPAGSPLAKY